MIQYPANCYDCSQTRTVKLKGGARFKSANPQGRITERFITLSYLYLGGRQSC